MLFLWTAILPANAQVNVTQKNNNLSRDGLYIDAAFTPGNAANLTRDLNFNGTISGNVHAQPLYIEGGPNGPMVIVVTASNNVYALHADTGAAIWSRTDIGPAVTSGLPCGNINPVGIIGTPVVDLAFAIAFLRCIDRWHAQEAFYLLLERGHRRDPFRLAGGCEYAVPGFTSLVQEERGGLALVNGIVYVPYSGYFGDCGPITAGWSACRSTILLTWVRGRRGHGGGIWGHSGVASDGTNMFVITGNTFKPETTGVGGEAIVRLQAGSNL